MTRNLLLAAALFSSTTLFSGCRAAAERPHVRADVRVDRPTEGRPTLGMPISVPGQDLQVVPFTMDRAMTWAEDTFGKSSSDGLRYRSFQSGDLAPLNPPRGEPDGPTIPLFVQRSVSWHNAVLVRAQPGTSGLVIDGRGVVTQLALVGKISYDEDGRPVTDIGAVLFTTVTEDTNGDGTLTHRDSQTLLAGDGAGHGLHAITPPGTQIAQMRYDFAADTLFLLVTADTDGDGRFTQADRSQPYTYTPGDEGVARPMVNDDLIERAESYLR